MQSRSHKRSNSAPTRKAKRTFVLSREAVDFLEAETKKRGRRSASLVVEEMIQDCRRKQHSGSVDAAISAYYDSLSDEEREENKRWGEFAESQLPLD